MPEYDYIIIGAGAAGLMLADAMGKDAYFSDKSILLLDKDDKKTNDRTWCFWEKGEGEFDAIVHKKWNYIFFGGQEFSNLFKIAPYTYKVIKGIDFYEDYLNRIKNYPNIHFKQETVSSVVDSTNFVTVTTTIETYRGKKVMNSIFDYKMATYQTKYPVLQQHFIGWFIKTEKPVFKEDQATFMDFSVPQEGNTRFMYVLPFSDTEALLEYTLFSEHLLPKEEYETAIKDYVLEEFGTVNYTITDQEQGSIPMTCYDFKEHHSKNIRYIGMAGGWAKPSTGYTFMSTARKIPKLIAHLKSGSPLNKLSFKTKFWFYDLILLDILKRDNSLGQEIFESLFRNRKPQKIFKFLDEKTSILEDIEMMAAPSPWPFTRALLSRIFNR
ncbi:lycopene cyclase family protein [Maribacter sp. 2210JD10-5]|uniref:lycopene cyclase family protein n=1 Tax=Maribacter sp. 2210JD10-5 TaxID=3386272 RepID=UPI0039BCB86B